MKKAFLIYILITVYCCVAHSQKFNYLPSSTTKQIIKHSYYTISYSEKYEQAEWVAYQVTKERVYGGVERTNNFREDPKVQSGSAKLSDYKGSGYDRGHLIPAAVCKFNKIAMSESFFLSNMSPQTASFNRGVWKNLESQVRTWAIKNDQLFVITGPILSPSLETIGQGVGVPKYYYKIILDNTEPDIKIIALLLANEKGNKPLSQYVVTVDSVEALTGIDFFPSLPDVIENKIEGEKNIKGWGFSVENTSSNQQAGAKTQCKGKTKQGIRCKIRVTLPKKYCHHHIKQQ